MITMRSTNLILSQWYSIRGLLSVDASICSSGRTLVKNDLLCASPQNTVVAEVTT